MASVQPGARAAAAERNPVLVRLWRAEAVESEHAGSWVLVDARGAVVEGAGDWSRPVFVRSAMKSLQALPLIESGAAGRYELGPRELALALASHDAEPQHVVVVRGLLARLGLGERHLQCGPQTPASPETRAELAAAGAEPGPIHNNCSGKHAGFLALALHLGMDPADYLDPDGAGQAAVRQGLLETCSLEGAALSRGLDGCNAPTYRMPLAALATGIARVANPEGLPPARRSACERMLAAVESHPELIAGSRRRLCTDLARATRGRLFPKIGAEGVYAVGARGSGRGLAVKIDDGAERALGPLVLALLQRFSLLEPGEAAGLEGWRQRILRNRAGVAAGRTEVLA